MPPDNYQFLEDDLRPLLEVPLDGVPVKYAQTIRRFLNNACNGRLIGLEGIIPWPPNFPNLNFLLFFYVITKNMCTAMYAQCFF